MTFKPVFPATVFLLLLAAAVFGQPVGDSALDPRPATAAPSVIEFRGAIDGSARIEITASSATWHHLDRQLPASPVHVNGIAWNPRAGRTLDNGGATKFLDESVDFSLARLEVISARDTVAMIRSADRIMLHLNDTPNGAAEYRFRVVFTPPQATSLRIKARIDGSDTLHLSRDGARWEHKHWGPPSQVTINGRDWNPNRQPTLPNRDETAFLPLPVDFSTARIVHKNGRDTAVVMSDQDGATIHFADNPNGADDYEVIIAFGK